MKRKKEKGSLLCESSLGGIRLLTSQLENMARGA